MKNRWPFEVLREEESGEPSGAPKGEAPKTFNINGKEVSIETATSAFNLYQSLQDPEVGKEIVGTLAERMGLLKANGEPRKDAEAKVEGKITKMLRAKFGKDGEKFVDMAGPAIDEAISEYFAEFKESQTNEVGANTWDSAVDTFMEDHTVTTEIQTAMQDVIKEMGGVPKGLKGKAAQTYLTRMYKLAIEEAGIEPPNEQPKSRGRNRRAAEDDLPDFREIAAPKGVPSLDQILEDAMAGRRYKR